MKGRVKGVNGWLVRYMRVGEVALFLHGENFNSSDGKVPRWCEF
jgi:hypothetical protein